MHDYVVRTTIDLPDSLWRQARGRARAAGTTLSEVVAEALRSFLTSTRQPEAPYEVLTFGTPGAGFPTEITMGDSLDAEDADRLSPALRKPS